MSENAISIESVSFSYNKEPVLNNISFSVPINRICFVMGNNGSGKTTLIKNILGFLSPQSGTIRVLGKEVSKLERHSMSKLVSYVPQAIHLNTDFTVIDYLALGRTPHIGTISSLKDNDYQIIEDYSKRLGIDTIYDTAFNELSGGQKQIVAIARSLIQDTPLIIMDEPMSALDIGKQAELLRLLSVLSKTKTILLTTHNPNHALTITSDACFLHTGTIAAYGDSKAIIHNSILHKIYGDSVVMNNDAMRNAVVFSL